MIRILPRLRLDHVIDKACLRQAILCYHVEIPDNNDESYTASWKNSIAGATRCAYWPAYLQSARKNEIVKLSL